MSPFPSSISQIWLTIGSSFLHSGGHKDKGTSAFVILYLVPVGVNAEGTTELGKLERGSKGLMVVECPGSTVSPWVGCGEPGSGVSGCRCLLGCGGPLLDSWFPPGTTVGVGEPQYEEQ